MTNDDFLAALRADWRRQSIDVRDLAARVDRRQRRAGLVMLWKSLGAAALAILAVAFGAIAIRYDDALFGIAALALLLATPAALFEILDHRRAMRLRYDDGPAGLLRQARDQAGLARRQLRSCRIAALLLAGAGLAAWALVPAGFAQRDAVLIITLVWAMTAALSWLWQHWRDRRLAEEIARYDSLEADLDDEG